MKIRYSLLLIVTLLTSFLFYNCSKTEEIPQDIKINDFVWGGMNAYYKWQGEVLDLADNRFVNRNQLNNYLAGFNAPDDLFYSLISYQNEYPRDPQRIFSWIVDDYIALEDSFQGRRLTSGMKVTLNRYEDGSNNVYAYVRDVVIGSDAENNGVTRGMIFSEINGTQITIGNYNDLFDLNSFTISLADFNGGNPIVNGSTINVTKTDLQENPVKIAKTVFDNGTTKIGYLMYNQFSTEFDDELNNAFATFKADAITDLIVDLRYNGGGSVRSAIYLGSMISTQSNDAIFAKQIWNNKVMSNINNSNFIDYFTDQINNGIVSESINSLNLNTVYFIVSDATASASELVINALKAYIDVKLVGTQTVGKQVGSITLYDSDDYTRNGPNFNTSHAWAIQPIVLEIQNKDNENEPEGYIPEVEIEEDPANLGVLGDPNNEPLLERTIQYILTGSKGVSTQKRSFKTDKIWDSNMTFLDYNNMYVELK
ncbi:C-terminal processing protease CtpA/Prc [Tenacibaculum adriaticum]|uniref:C-terminal processing protease CtpA/Prc n=1 Tax=Tenacibaculum adriaticum TaxID=413713 RepID=A0A5S5DX53_9FLAO|nr:S41 family peptidase [Tenacibaculum adriaticum]TYP99199.1 C-terminal processing protease CtpA/Prc [Tenacibaculum adriaticum]